MQASVVGVPRLLITVSIIVVHLQSCFTACRIVPDQGMNPSPTLADRFFTNEPPWKPNEINIKNTKMAILLS